MPPRVITSLLKPETFQHYVEAFNQVDRETVVNDVSNAAAWDWMRTNVPLFELYVSPSGNDGWSGKLAAPNVAKTDGPLVSLVAAQEAIRELKAARTAGGTG